MSLPFLWLLNFMHKSYQAFVRQDPGEGEKMAPMGHVIMKELGQSIIHVLTEFFVSNSTPLCLAGYHVHPIYILSYASQSSVSPCLEKKKDILREFI